MSDGTWFIDRPEVDFDAIQHAYSMDGSADLPGGTLGVSTVAKVGGVDKAWDIASAWGFRVGYEGVHTHFEANGGWRPFTATVWPRGDERPSERLIRTKDDLREALSYAKLTPWATRDKAAERGSWVHDALEELGQEGTVHDPAEFEAKHGAEAEGHRRSLLAWFLHFRPAFVALEVQVASRTHIFAGRYDVRCKIDARRLRPCLDPLRNDEQAINIRGIAAVADHRKLPTNHPDAMALGLVDLKTSKGIYPETHFPQLEGYEGAGVEMGYPATDFRAVINTWPTGEHEPARDFAISWSTYDHFLAFLGAMRAIRDIKDRDPATMRKKARDEALIGALRGGEMRSREVVALGLPELAGMDAKAVGKSYGYLAKKGRVEKGEKGFWRLPS